MKKKIKEKKIEDEIIDMTKRDTGKMREAGCDLAIAAIRVAKDYDGIHRLMLAVSRWCEIISNEGGRKYKEVRKED